MDIRHARDGSIDERIKQAKFVALPYDEVWGAYRLILYEEDIHKNTALLRDLIHLAYQNRAD